MIVKTVGLVPHTAYAELSHRHHRIYVMIGYLLYFFKMSECSKRVPIHTVHADDIPQSTANGHPAGITKK